MVISNRYITGAQGEVLYELLDMLLDKLISEDTRLQLAEKISLVVLFVITKLREQHKTYNSTQVSEGLLQYNYLPCLYH